jgi:hypothetical protein
MIERRPQPSEMEIEKAMGSAAYGRLLGDLRSHQKAFWLQAILAVAQTAAKTAFWVLMAIALAWLGFMATDRSDPVTNNKRETLSLFVHPGDAILTRRSRVRLKECEVKSQEVVIDSSGRRFDFDPQSYVTFGVPQDEPVIDVRGPRAPRDMAEGEAVTFTVLAFYCNALHRALDWPIVRITPRNRFHLLPAGTPYPEGFVPPVGQQAGAGANFPPAFAAPIAR